jgi:XTP/dITP diphosphohydrolase
MPFPPRIAIASKNAHKLREIERICSGWPVEWVTVASGDPSAFPDVDETGETYLENALLKARAVAAALDLPALADDSGIEVDAIGGNPGPRSARYAGEAATDDQNLHALLGALKGVPTSGRTARYRCVAVLALQGGEPIFAEGICEGSLRVRPRGTDGFGYDPIFEPVGRDVTMAELSADQKDRISHRGRALRALGQRLGS